MTLQQSLQETLDRFAAGTARLRGVAEILENAAKPAESATILAFRAPKSHPLFFIGVKDDVD